MEEQVIVEDGIHAAMLQHGSDMLVQFLAYHKRMVQLLHQDFFFLAELVRILRIDGRKWHVDISYSLPSISTVPFS